MQESQERVARNVQLPNGYRLEWVGEFRNLQQAVARLMVVVPIALAIIAVLLYSQGMLEGGFHVPFWVVLACQAAMGIGTLAGGWRIVHTMGSKITRLTPMQGCAAEHITAVLFLPVYTSRPRRIAMFQPFAAIDPLAR